MARNEASKQNWRGILEFTVLMVLTVVVVALVHRGDYTPDGIAARQMPVVDLMRMGWRDWTTLVVVPLRMLGWMPIIILLLAIIPVPFTYVIPMLGYTPLISYVLTSGAYNWQALAVMLPMLVLYCCGMTIATTDARRVSRIVNAAAWHGADLYVTDVWASVKVYWQTYRQHILPLLGIAVGYSVLVGVIATLS